MAIGIDRTSAVERALASLGFFLIALVGWVSERPLNERATLRGAVRRAVDAPAMALVTAIGWMVDRLPFDPSAVNQLQASGAGGWNRAAIDGQTPQAAIDRQSLASR